MARSAFGDTRVFLEKLVDPARHIEVQVLADKHGHVKIIGERECSLQRKHQKVIEECPCVFLPDSVRQRIYKASEKMAREAHYQSAGTVEWIWDGREGIYFLEVNTRLQVEHPVTEEVWGIDLVEWQIRIAQNESIESISVQSKGHSVEARICAEDPAQDFLPSGGKIHRLQLPKDVRIEFGFKEKNTVPAQFDSMLGKIISSGANRIEALENLKLALERLVIMGPTTNRTYLIQLLNDSRVQKGDISTDLLKSIPPRFDLQAALRLMSGGAAETCDTSDDLDIYSPWGGVQVAQPELLVEDFVDKRYFHAKTADWSKPRPRTRSMTKGPSEVIVDQAELKSPMPAKINKVFVKKGDTVKKGDVVLMMEAMKMEHQVKAPKEAKVKEVLVKEGDRVSVESVLVQWEA